MYEKDSDDRNIGSSSHGRAADFEIRFDRNLSPRPVPQSVNIADKRFGGEVLHMRIAL